MSKNPLKASEEQVLWMFKRLFEDTIAFGVQIKTNFLDANFIHPDGGNAVTYTINHEEKTTSFVIENERYFRHLTESYVLSLHRLLTWAGAMKRRGIIPKPSPLRDFHSQLRDFHSQWVKEVRELRDFLMHLEEYIVLGGGRRKEKFGAGIGPVGGDPTSTIRMTDCFVNGQFIKQAYLIGARLDFYSSLQSLQDTFLLLHNSNFFTAKTEETQ